MTGPAICVNKSSNLLTNVIKQTFRENAWKW